MKSPIDLFAILDRELIRYHQQAYDYLLDRFGVLLGQYRQGLVAILFATNLPSAWNSTTATVWLTAGGLLLIALQEPINILQRYRRFASINHYASEAEQEVGYRLFFFAVIGFGLIRDLAVGNLVSVVGDIPLLVWLQDTAVRVRDRDDSRFRRLVPQAGQA